LCANTADVSKPADRPVDSTHRDPAAFGHGRAPRIGCTVETERCDRNEETVVRSGFRCWALGVLIVGLGFHPAAGVPALHPLLPAAALPAAALPATALPVVQGFPPNTPPSALPVAVGWGTNNDGELGTGTKATSASPVSASGGQVLDGKVVTSIDAGRFDTCAIAEESLYCWGDNTFGQLGDNSHTASSVPIKVQGALINRRVTAVSVGQFHTCAVADQQVYCWGANFYGELGIGNQQNSSVPVAVRTDGVLKDLIVSAVSVGDNHSCVVAQARAYCWGWNVVGELGTGTTGGFVAVPASVSTAGSLKDLQIDAVVAGNRHTCALADGQVTCWGEGSSGQLGTGSVDDHATPAPIRTDGVLKGLGVTSLAAGYDNTCALAGIGPDRHAFCWGNGESGALGNGSLVDSSLPVKVTFAAAASSISVNSAGGCLISAGFGHCWGDPDSTGMLGTGNNPPKSTTPVPVDNDSSLSGRTLLTISAEASHTAAIAIKTATIPDVPADRPFYNDILWLAGTGVTTGYPDNTFRPTVATDRQAMSAFLYRLVHRGVADPTCLPQTTRQFGDVPTSSAFCGTVEWLAAAGITTTANPSFAPTADTNRAVMAAWIYRARHPGAADQKCTGTIRLFSDVKKSDPQCGNIEWLARAGVTTGFDDGTYRPTQPVRRDAMAAFFHRLAELDAH